MHTAISRLNIRRSALLFLLIFATTTLIGCSPKKQKPRVYVLGVDALRSDKFAQAETPNLDRLIENGAYVKNARASVSAQTRVNYVTLPTGTHADRHGVVGASYMNPNWQYRSTDYPDYRTAQKDLPVPTVFEVLDQELNYKSAYLATKGYELVGGRGADHQVYGEEYLPEKLWATRYDSRVDGSRDKSIKLKQEMNDHLLSKLLKLVRNRDPQFVLANFASLDYLGHQHGVGEAYLETITKTDRQIGQFISQLKELELWQQSTVVVVADHGMTEVENPKNVVMAGGKDEPDFPGLAEKGIKHAGFGRGGLSFSLYLKNETKAEETLAWLQKQDWTRKIYSPHELDGLDGKLADLNYYHPERSGDFFVTIEKSYSVGFSSRGQHGSLRDSDIKVPVIFGGRGIKQGVRLKAAAGVENVDVAPTLLKLLGLNPSQQLEAQGQALDRILK